MASEGHGSAPRAVGHRPGLDGLRGWAVAAVVAYHVGYLRGGFLGVDLFFVLSGYLITGLVLDEVGRDGSLSLRGFWARRIRRLVPALLVMTGAVLVAAIALDWPRNRFGDLRLDAISTLTWWANWRQAEGTSYWTGGENLFRHAWSLSIEEQFYVAWPLVVVACVALVRRRRPAQAPGASMRWTIGIAALVGAALSAAWSVVLGHRLPSEELSRAYVGTDTRVLAPLLGCALACAAPWFARRLDRRPVVREAMALAAAAGFVVLVVKADVASPTLYRQGWLVVAALLAAVLVVAAGAADAGERRPLSLAVTNPVARHLGTRSYAIYLWSWPIQVLVAFRWQDLERRELAAVAVVASLLAAEASYRVVEQPLRRRAGWAERPVLRRPAWAAALLVPVACLGVVAAQEEPPPAHEQLETTDAVADAIDRPPPTTAPPVTEPGGSTIPEQDQPLRVMLAGDSISWTVAYYAPVEALPEGIASVDQRALIGCGLLAADGWKYRSQSTGELNLPGGGACARQPEAEAIGLSGEPDVVLTFPRGWEGIDAQSPDGRLVEGQSDEMAALIEEQLLERVAAAHEAGATYVMAQWACPGSKVVGVLDDPSYARWFNDLLDRVVQRADDELGAAAKVLRPSEAVCEGADPYGAPTQAKIEATGDETHVVDFDGGRWIWEAWLAPELPTLTER